MSLFLFDVALMALRLFFFEWFFPQDELVNRPLSDIFITDCTAIQLQSQQRKEFDGELTVRGNLIEMLNVRCRTVPVACMGRNTTHVILTLAVTVAQMADDVLATLPPPQQKPEPRGSLHSLRRGSFDIRPFGSDGLRRTSIAKLSALPLEAPITKVCRPLARPRWLAL